MENNTKLIESLFEKATDYGKTSLELVKLKALDKTSDLVSTHVPQFGVTILLALFLLFFNLGIAFWLGEILGKVFYGFIAVGAFYLLLAAFIYLFLRKWIKRIMYNYIIQQVLK